jgi:hypothetical protein
MDPSTNRSASGGWEALRHQGRKPDVRVRHSRVYLVSIFAGGLHSPDRSGVLGTAVLLGSYAEKPFLAVQTRPTRVASFPPALAQASKPFRHLVAISTVFRLHDGTVSSLKALEQTPQKVDIRVHYTQKHGDFMYGGQGCCGGGVLVSGGPPYFSTKR